MFHRWLLLSALVCTVVVGSGCGSPSADLRAIQASPGQGGNGATAFRLESVWGGHFPGSSLQDPKAGIEIHFERPGRNVFIHRLPDEATRSTVTIEQQGSQLTLTFPGEGADVSVFRGQFVNANLVRGHWTNASRGESFELDLMSASSVLPLETLRPAPKEGAPLLTGPYSTLLIHATDESGRDYSFPFGMGYYYTPGSARVWGDLPIGVSQDFKNLNISAPTAVLQLAFYPDWIVFDIYTYYQQLETMASLEVKLEEFAQVSGETRSMNPYSSSYIGVFPNHLGVKSLTMSYISHPQQFDASRFACPAGQSETIHYSGKSYTLPANAARLLSGFRGVGQ